MVKNVTHLLKPKVTYLKYFFCQTNNPNTKDIQHFIILDKERQQILTIRKLELGNIWPFLLEKLRQSPF